MIKVNITKEIVNIRTHKVYEILDVTEKVRDILTRSKIKDGLLVCYVPHTTAAITINEGDETVFEDLIELLKKWVPRKGDYKHNAKYAGIPQEENAHAHIISSIIQPSITIPITNSRLELGTWQRVLFIELDGPRNRRVIVKIIGTK